MNSASEPSVRNSLTRAFAGLIATTGHDDLGALLAKGDGCGAADTGQGAGDQYDRVAHLLVPHSCFLPAEHGLPHREAAEAPKGTSRRRLLIGQIGTAGVFAQDFIG